MLQRWFGPPFPTAAGEPPMDLLTRVAEQGLAGRLALGDPAPGLAVYQAALARDLQRIHGVDAESAVLTLWDLREALHPARGCFAFHGPPRDCPSSRPSPPACAARAPWWRLTR